MITILALKYQQSNNITDNADSSVELKKKSELAQESAVAACKMYVPYISDITQQIEEVVRIFAMEKELR